MSFTAEDYRALLRQEDLSPDLRPDVERRLKNAEKREELHARIGERGRQRLLTHRWQQESLRVFHQFLAQKFEVDAWMQRDRRPLVSGEAWNTLQAKRRGMEQRIQRACREAAEGCPDQTEWLAMHAELISELQRPQENPWGRRS